MKRKIFSLILIILILSFSSVFAQAPSDMGSNSYEGLQYGVQNATTMMPNMADAYYTAYRYFYYNNASEIAAYDYVYILPSYYYDGVSTNHIQYYLICTNSEPAFYLKDGRSIRSGENNLYFSSAQTYYIKGIGIDLTDFSYTVGNSQTLTTGSSGGVYYGNYSSSLLTFDFYDHPSSNSTINFVGDSISFNGYKNVIFSKTGDIKYWTDYTFATKQSLIDNIIPPVIDYSYYECTNLNTGLGDNTNIIINYNNKNYYKTYQFNGHFSQYYETQIATDSDLYYTITIPGVSNALVYRRKISAPYSYQDEVNNISFDLNTGILSQATSDTVYITFEIFNGSFYYHEETFQFPLHAYASGSQSLDRYYDSSSTPPVVVNIFNTTQDNIDNGTYDYNQYTGSVVDPLNYDWTSYFSNIFSFFRVAFAWLPVEIINIVATGFFILMGVMIYKFFRG